jgi:hypothetical protein
MLLDRVIDAIFIFGFPLGVIVGYWWRGRISHARRARYLAERNNAAADKPVSRETDGPT